ncbi:MAG: zinc-binding dehydrogenase [Rhodospirillaceae bacterium]|nr:zinc-binding dehydrogenase [Rhodospirillaceae bacterium]
MRAAVLHAPGPPEAFRLEDLPQPAVAAGDVLIAVAACGVSMKDVVERNGTYRRDMSFPIVIGAEIAGTVAALGAEVVGLAIGDRVCTKAFASCGQCRYCRSGRETTCLARRPVRGGYGEFAAVPADACVKVGADVPLEQACTLGLAAGVALNAVRDTAQVALGETVLVTGASGGVGLAAVQLAHLAGARVIGLTRSEEKAALLRDWGADAAVVAQPGENFAKAVRALTDGAGADVVIDTVGSPVFHGAFDSLALHGRYALVGQLTGEETSINLARIFFKRAKLLGVGSVSRAQLADVARLAEQGLLKTQIAAVLPLDRIAEAHRQVEAGRAFGRIVVAPGRRA